jgi:fibronectin type 3 domain-containing protein
MCFKQLLSLKRSLVMYKLFVLSALFVLLASCGGGQSDGNKKADDLSPTADASIVGLAADTSGSEKSFSARANNEIMLTAKNSQPARTPILTFEWTQLEGPSVNWVADSTDTRKFTAPNVRVATQLRFQLRVTDANKKSDTDTLTLNLIPSDDANQFLNNPSAPANQLRILVALQGGTSTGAADQAFTIKANYIAHWRNRLGVMDEMQVHSGTVSSSFPQNFSPAVNYTPFTEPKNPVLSFDIRPINRDDINRSFNDATNISRRLEASEISTASIEIQLEVEGTPTVNFELFAIDSSGVLIPGPQILTPLSSTSTANIPSPRLQKTQATNGALLQTWNNELSASLLSESILVALGIPTKATANNYYLLLDPTAQFIQLKSWLTYAGFTGTHEQLISDPSIAHAVYYNNYDLGYGRTAWMRKDANGNIFSYITNFPSAEAALSCRNDFSVFAMEYSNNPDPNGINPKIAKFYAFVPDKLTGHYVRTSTINIDGRGEKPIPEACAGCHQGFVTNNQFATAADADIGAKFLPFDVSGFLFGKAQNTQLIEPGFNPSQVTPQQIERHSKENLETAFRQFNLGVLSTYVANPSANTEAIRLIHGWYGDLNPNFVNQAPTTVNQKQDAISQKLDPIGQLPNNPFNGNYVQPGWIGQENLYRNVYARYCRTCHTQFTNSSLNFASYTDFINNPNLIDQVFQQGLMPFSRLTMDRFWTPPANSGTSAANLLRTHLQGLNQTVPTSPGLPVPRFSVSDPTPSTSQTIVLDATPSKFAKTYRWSLVAPNGSNAQLNNTTGLTTSFTPDLGGVNYQIILTVTNEAGEEANFSQTISSANRIPVAECFTANTSSLTSSGLLASIPVTSVITDLGDGGLHINSVTQGSLGSVTISPDGQTLSYQLNDPFVRGVDTITYQLRDADGSLSTTSPSCNPQPTPGFGSITIDSTNAGVSAPANLTALQDPVNNTSSIRVNWDLSTAVDGYNVYRNATATGAPLNANLLTSSNFVDTGLTPATAYNYSVVAVIGSFRSNPTAVSVTTFSLTPSNLLTSSIATNQINLNWTAPVGNATDYAIYRDAASVPLVIVPAATTNFSDFTVTAGNQYAYRLTARDSATNESPAIGPATGTSFPDAPNTPTATAIHFDRIDVSWSAVFCSSAVSYLLTPSVGPAIPTTTTNVSVTGLMGNTTYTFVVSAVCNGLTSATSPTSSPVTTPPGVPTNLAATPVDANQINLTWTGITGATVDSYLVYRNSSLINTISPPVTNFSDTGLNSGSQYTYEVSAVISGVETNRSTFVATATFPNVPTIPTAAVLSDTQISVNWSPGVFCSSNTPTYTVTPSVGSPLSTGATNINFTGLTANTSYSFKVRITCNGLTSADSPGSSPVTTLPSPPTGLVATPGFNSIDLNWDPEIGPHDGFVIYKDNQPIDSVASSIFNYFDPDLNGGTAFNYQISVVVNSVESPRTAVVVGATFPDRPNTPIGTPISASQIDVRWDPITCTDTPLYTLTTTPGSSVTTSAATFSVTGLTALTTYIFKVQARCNGLDSLESFDSDPVTTFQ